MAGLSAISSKLDFLQKKTKVTTTKRSVVYESEYAQWLELDEFPDNINSSGIMIVPDPVTIEEWEALCLSEMQKNKTY